MSRLNELTIYQSAFEIVNSCVHNFTETYIRKSAATAAETEGGEEE